MKFALPLALAVVLGLPSFADMIPAESDTSHDLSLADTVSARLVELGAAPTEAQIQVARLSPDELAFLANHPSANSLVGQEEIIGMFWYEWVAAAAAIYVSSQIWYDWGKDAFFRDDPDDNADE